MPGVLKENTTERGDTLVEVLVALAVLGVVIVGAFSLMNRGVAQVYDSMERSEVRMLINQQTESLTYARDMYRDPLSSPGYDQAAKTVWEGVRDNVSSLTTGVPALTSSCNTTPQYAFWVDDSTGSLVLKQGVSKVTADAFPSPGAGIWIQKIDSPAAVAVPYIDFYIRACWRQTSSSQTQVLSTVVRLYDAP